MTTSKGIAQIIYKDAIDYSRVRAHNAGQDIFLLACKMTIRLSRQMVKFISSQRIFAKITQWKVLVFNTGSFMKWRMFGNIK
ncbi:Uncharacterised protein [Serratia ficaria]|uniref:Uncharacterized protein n=1 Tax=Serratia ficaria TaxID=61651 RepID=A0A240BP66_SERFI|nr:hypothetical protein C7332_4024 [Serratia ficaria]CAI0860601.1 Uncharacterised protein [Serratia ficaria]CAI0876110.1 Uncharacterised protein [Serratia ficaria]CAI0921784.1 Uncharacterised protein [Serratia ficaria]CAI0972692.1 Uncharacterised protein [Serratia ficaria]